MILCFCVCCLSQFCSFKAADRRQRADRRLSSAVCPSHADHFSVNHDEFDMFVKSLHSFSQRFRKLISSLSCARLKLVAKQQMWAAVFTPGLWQANQRLCSVCGPRRVNPLTPRLWLLLLLLCENKHHFLQSWMFQSEIQLFARSPTEFLLFSLLVLQILSI